MLRITRRASQSALLLLLSYCLGRAEQTVVENQNAVMTVELSGIAAGTPKVSGTKVEFTFGAEVRIRTEQGSPAPYWNFGKVTNVELKIGGLDLDEHVTYEEVTNRVSKLARWASTKFDHDSVQAISIQAQMRLEKRDGSGAVIVSNDVTVGPLLLNVRTYNLLYSLGTRKFYPPNNLPPTILEPPDAVLTVILDSLREPRVQFSPKFALAPLSDTDALYQSVLSSNPEREIRLNSRKTNVDWMLTHGSTTGLESSAGDEITWAEWRDFVMS